MLVEDPNTSIEKTLVNRLKELRDVFVMIVPHIFLILILLKYRILEIPPSSNHTIPNPDRVVSLVKIYNLELKCRKM